MTEINSVMMFCNRGIGAFFVNDFFYDYELIKKYAAKNFDPTPADLGDLAWNCPDNNNNKKNYQRFFFLLHP